MLLLRVLHVLGRSQPQIQRRRPLGRWGSTILRPRGVGLARWSRVVDQANADNGIHAIVTGGPRVPPTRSIPDEDAFLIKCYQCTIYPF